MSWITFIWSVAAGICLTLMGVHFLVWFRARESWANFFLSLSAAGAAACITFELALMYSQTTEQAGEMIQWMRVPIGLTVVSLVWFIHLYLRAGRPWLAWLICVLRVLALVINFALPPNINLLEVTSLLPISFLGETVAVPIGVMSPWAYITKASALLWLAFVVDAVITAWRRGNRRHAMVLGAAMSATITMGMTMSTLMMLGKLRLPYTMSLAYLPMILVIGCEMSQDSLRALQLSRKLSETQKRMNLAAIAADLGMWEWDLAKDEFWATDISRARIGAADAERITLSQFLKSIHPDDREPTLRAATQAIDSGSQFQVEYRRVTPEGPIGWFSAKGEVVHGRNAKPLLVRGVSMDITALKQVEDALKESEARLKEAQRIAHIGNWELDLMTDTLTWSDEIFRIFEIDPQHFGASYASFLAAVHPEDRDMVDNIYTQSLKNGHPYAVSHRLLMPDGRTKYVHEQGQTLYSPEGTPLSSIGTVQDITELKKAESERIQLRNELSHLNRAMTMSELSASLAHEINQPLGAILNNASAARVLNAKLEEAGAEVGEILADIIADATRAGEIIHKIRGIVSKEEAKFEQLDMNVLIRKVFDLYRNILNIEKTSVSLDLQPDLSPVRGDRIQLQQVLMNFLSNASEAMRPSSTRHLSILSTTQSPDTIAVSVRDSGPGVDEAQKAKIFQPFFTTKREGLGMGLRICQSIIEEHGGRIWAENNPAGGATFSFSLKAYQGDSG